MNSIAGMIPVGKNPAGAVSKTVQPFLTYSRQNVEAREVIWDGHPIPLQTLIETWPRLEYGAVLGAVNALPTDHPEYPLGGAWMHNLDRFAPLSLDVSSIPWASLLDPSPESPTMDQTVLRNHLFRLPMGGVLVIITPQQSMIFHDYFGQIPLYYAVVNGTLLFTTDYHRLSALNISKMRISHLQTASSLHAIRGSYYQLPSPLPGAPTDDAFPLDHYATLLLQALQSAIDRIPPGTSCPVLLSGGIDSSILAALLSKANVASELFTLRVGAKNPDLEAAQLVADHLTQPLIISSIDPGLVEQTAGSLLRILPSPAPMHLGVALGTYFGLLTLKKAGHTWGISGGGGPDELAAGYYRHAKLLDSNRPSLLAQQLLLDLSTGIPENLQRDYAVSQLLDVPIFYPYLDSVVVDLLMHTPLQYKITKLGGQIIRKQVVRRVGELVGLPQEICDRPKKAIQYSTGIHKLLQTQIRHHGFQSIREWIHHTLDLPPKDDLAKLCDPSFLDGVPR